MKIGLATPDDRWAVACRELDVPYLLLPCSAPNGDVGAADLQARHRAGTQAFDILQRDPVDFILDVDGAGLTFVDGAKGCGDLKLTHEMLQIPLVSYCAGSMPHALRGLPWPVVWHVLGSRMWTKILCAKDSVDELTRFGVPNCVCLPPATSRPMDAPSSNDRAPEVIFVGDAASWTRPQTALANTGADRISRIAAAFQIGHADRSFYDIYHDVFRVAVPPDANDSPEARLKKATEYFRVGQLYQADLTVTLRDRFVVFLKGRLGQRFQIAGKGWEGAYGIHASADPRVADTPSEPQGQGEIGVPSDPQTRGVDRPLLRIGTVNIVLPEADGGSSVIRNHLAIAAGGGFVLCYDQAELADHFTPGKECAVFESEQDLLDKIQYYLSHPEERAAIARAGQKRTLAQHLYSHRLGTLLKTVVGRPLPVEYSTTTWSEDFRTLMPDPDIVLDCGANRGQTAESLRNLYPRAQIYSFEPVRSCFEALEKTCAQIGVHAVHKAVGDRDGKARIHLTASPECHSLLGYQEGNPCAKWTWVVGEEEVDVCTLDSWCEHHQLDPGRVDIIKLDVQGAELQALFGARKLLKTAKLIYLEVAFVPIYKECPLFEEIEVFMGECGYRRAAIYPSDQPHHWGDALYVKV